jgi:hypothetical protein
MRLGSKTRSFACTSSQQRGAIENAIEIGSPLARSRSATVTFRELLGPPVLWSSLQRSKYIKKTRKPAGRFASACGPVAGWGEQRLYCVRRSRQLLAPVRPGNSNRKDLSLPRDSSSRAATGDIEGTLGFVAGEPASRLGRQAATPVVRQRALGRSEPASLKVPRAFIKACVFSWLLITHAPYCIHRASPGM